MERFDLFKSIYSLHNLVKIRFDFEGESEPGTLSDSIFLAILVLKKNEFKVERVHDQ